MCYVKKVLEGLIGYAEPLVCKVVTFSHIVNAKDETILLFKREHSLVLVKLVILVQDLDNLGPS